jgi:hypothetical protein
MTAKAIVITRQFAAFDPWDKNFAWLGRFNVA